jgi:O-succinylbenzoate synthase
VTPAPWPGRGLGPVIHTGLARGRAWFNRGAFWSAHEAWEPAWKAAAEPERALIQGLILCAAGYHKLLVQDNAAGAARLLGRAAGLLANADADALGLDWAPFAAQVADWRARAGRGDPVPAVAVGLPRLEWSNSEAARLIRLDSFDAWRMAGPDAGAVVVAVEAGGLQGMGECRLAWERRGVWESLTQTLGPAVLAEPIAAPTELGVLWSDLIESEAARAGLEAAVWDLYARGRNETLAAALGLEPRTLELAKRVEAPGGAVEEWPARLCDAIRRAVRDGFATVVVPLAPHADRRVAAEVVACEAAVIADLGGGYQRSDMAVLQSLGGSGLAILARPFPDGDVVQSARLKRGLGCPLAVGFATAEACESGFMAAAFDVAIVDPGRTGLTEALRIAAYLHERRRPLWVASSARHETGALADLVLACHPAATVAPLIAALPERPPASGGVRTSSAAPLPGAGLGLALDRAALDAAAIDHVRLVA